MMEPTQDNRPGPNVDNETDNTDLEYGVSTSQETVREVEESHAELTHSTCSDEELEKKPKETPPPTHTHKTPTRAKHQPRTI